MKVARTVWTLTKSKRIVRNGENPVVMTGTVAITGTKKFGSTLTADISGLTNAGTPTYQWNRDGVAIEGATTSTYVLVEADITKTITVTVTADGIVGTGSITSAATGVIAKADGPAAPTGLAGVAPTALLNDGKITGTTIDMQYKLASADDSAYVDCSDIETVVAAAGDYVVRLAAKPGFNAGTTAAVTVPAYVVPATLSSIAITTPATKVVYKVGEILDITGMVVTGTYSDSSTKVETVDLGAVTGFNSSAVVASQTLNVTVGGKTATYDISVIKSDGPASPAAPTVNYFGKDYVRLNTNNIYEYSKDGVNWQVGDYFGGLTEGTPYTFYARVKETDTHLASLASSGTTVTTKIQLAQVQKPEWGTDSISWIAVPNASHYVVYIYKEGQTQVVGGEFVYSGTSCSITSFSSAITTKGAGIYTAKVTALAPIGDVYSNGLESEPSNPYVVPMSMTSKSITNLDFSTAYSTQAKLISKPVILGDFTGNRKEFTIVVGVERIPIYVDWKLSTDFSKGAAMGGVVESHIQNYFFQKYGLEGFNIRSVTAYGFDDTFEISTFQTGFTAQFTLEGRDWAYFFEQSSVQGSDLDTSNNRSFSISDGTNTATIQLTSKFITMDTLVSRLNNNLTAANVEAKVEKVNETQFKITSTSSSGILIIDGINKVDMFE